ncbi:thiamine pyrophosphate-binding protein [Brevibacterium sp.]|uniref:thiamine pyrophosphate-binding protein n=1 Tax=Brevibacterium sp. TaxID=1701 RepID=UPI002810BA78|nr:thiamine pyrophosphate-binding protein [Brevibacterium sp.]
MNITAGEALARTVAAFKPGLMLGMGGFQLLPFYDAARRLGLPHHLINDERAAIFAADAYAKATGRVGVVDATLGPGATNLVTGLVESLNAGVPIVAIVGDTHRDHSWKNMTQESRQCEILRPAVKELLDVTTPLRVPELVKRAFAIATSGRPGPVVINIPESVTHAEWDYDETEFEVNEAFASIPAYRTRPASAALLQAAHLVAESERPIILAGGGVHLSGAWSELTEFAEALNIPVAHTMTGKGAISDDNPLSAGLFGRYDRIANTLIAESDLVITIGCKLGEIATKRYTVPPANSRVIQIDSVAEEIGRTREIELGLWGDARETLVALHEELSEQAEGIRQKNAAYTGAIPEKMAAWKTSVRARLESTEVPINMARALNEINEILPADGYLIADGGFAAHWGALLFDAKQAGRQFLPDRGFASIGYGLPGAIGASLASPETAVLAITGDGGFNMMLGELETARRLGTNATIMIVNNAASGYIKALQHLMYGEEGYHASDLEETNFAEVAQAMGVHGVRVEDPDAFGDSLRECLATPGISVLDVVVTRDPAKMLPGVDSRAAKFKKGDRIA